MGRYEEKTAMAAPQTKLTPYLCFKDTAGAMAFYVKAFGAVEAYRLAEPSGKVGHAEMNIGDARFMLSDEYPDFGALSAQSMGGCPITLHLSVENVDAFVDDAVKAGATLLRPVKDEFYGDRTGQVADPFGYKWMIATPKENVSPQEMQKRWSKMLAG
jgi:PhnB protein